MRRGRGRPASPKDAATDVGLLFPFRNPPRWRVPFPRFHAEQLHQVELAEELGYDTVWLTEHHFAEDGYSPSLVPLAGAIAARTERVHIGTFLLLLPLHHPMAVGEAVATLDVLSNGRFDLGVGQGYVPRKFAGFGVSRPSSSVPFSAPASPVSRPQQRSRSVATPFPSSWSQ